MNNAATMLDPYRSPHGDIFEGLAAAARAAASWEVAFRPTGTGKFPVRVLARRSDLLKIEREVAGISFDPSASDPRTNAIRDLRANVRLLRSGITAATIKPQDMEKLPRLVPTKEDEPRIAGVCALYIRAVRGEFSGSTFTAFIRALQDHDPLTVFELWNLAAFLRFCLLEAIIDQAHALLRNAETADVSHRRQYRMAARNRTAHCH